MLHICDSIVFGLLHLVHDVLDVEEIFIVGLHMLHQLLMGDEHEVTVNVEASQGLLEDTVLSSPLKVVPVQWTVST